MCYNMLARKAGYTHYEGLQEHGQSGTTSYAGMEERRFGRLLRQTIVIVGIIGAFMLACVALSAIKANNSYVLMQHKLHARQLQHENEMLRVDIAKLGTPDRIYKEAKKLGMVMPVTVLYGQSHETSGTANTSH